MEDSPFPGTKGCGDFILFLILYRECPPSDSFFHLSMNGWEDIQVGMERVWVDREAVQSVCLAEIRYLCNCVLLMKINGLFCLHNCT